MGDKIHDAKDTSWNQQLSSLHQEKCYFERKAPVLPSTNRQCTSRPRPPNVFLLNVGKQYGNECVKLCCMHRAPAVEVPKEEAEQERLARSEGADDRYNRHLHTLGHLRQRKTARKESKHTRKQRGSEVIIQTKETKKKQTDTDTDTAGTRRYRCKEKSAGPLTEPLTLICLLVKDAMLWLLVIASSVTTQVPACIASCISVLATQGQGYSRTEK